MQKQVLKKQDLSEWAEGKQKPMTPGVYMVDQGTGRDAYAYFDGKKWFHGSSTPALAMIAYAPAFRTQMQTKPRWRGLSLEYAIKAGWAAAEQMPDGEESSMTQEGIAG